MPVRVRPVALMSNELDPAYFGQGGQEGGMKKGATRYAAQDPVLDCLAQGAADEIGEVLAVDRVGGVVGCRDLLHDVGRARLSKDGHFPDAALSIILSHKDIVVIGSTFTAGGSKVYLAHGLVHRGRGAVLGR